MKMTIDSKVVCAVIFLTILFNNQTNHSQQLALPNDIIAVVGGYQISVSDFQQRYSDYLLASNVKDNAVVRNSILNNMINELILFNYDDNSSIVNDFEFKKENLWAEKQTIIAFLRDREVYAKIKVTENEIRDAFYKSQEKLFARHLYAQTEEEANSLYQLLQTGVSFNELAKQIFVDTVLANNGGYLGGFSWGDMDPDFEDAAYSLKVGEVSKPIKTRYGYSIIKLENRVPNPLITESEFLKKRSHMEKIVRIRKKKPSEIAFLNSVFQNDRLWYDEKILSNIYNNLRYSTTDKIERQNFSDLSSICVKYTNKTYTRGEIEQRLNEIPIYHQEKITSLESLKTVIKGLVIQDLFLDMAKKKGYDKNPEVIATIKKYKNNLYLRYKRKEINDKATFPENQVKAFYENNTIYFKTSPEINVQEIIVSKKLLADSIFVELNNGADFGELAEKFSLREWSAKNKGVMGWSELDKFGFIKDTLWNSEIGNIVGPIEIQNKFGIFRVLDKKESRVKDFSLVKDEALRLLKKEKSREIMENYIDKLKSNFKIEINEQLLNSVPVNFY